ncbi:hypothetical protein Q2T40_00270 [Winogradskyella maritima]|nr:hypothetical protein [Winogradskyella maritima]
MLKDFKLSDEDIKIDFDKISSDLYKLTWKKPRKTSTDRHSQRLKTTWSKTQLRNNILAKPKENQITDITHQVMQIIGYYYPIPDQEIKVYIDEFLTI